MCMTWDGTKWTKAGLALNGTADSNQMFIWSASARDRIAFTTGPGEAARESEHVFMRGLKENVEIQTDTAQQWQWRRIVFSNKGHFGTNAFTSIASLPNAGYGRGVLPLTGTYLSSVEAEVFRGTDTNDWVDPYLCPLNNDRITVHSDERHVIGGGFQGSTKMFKKWNAFNKNFVYNDQQNGSSYTTEPFASTGKRGMGDIFVIDMFRAGFGASATDHLEYRPNSTLYWHER